MSLQKKMKQLLKKTPVLEISVIVSFRKNIVVGIISNIISILETDRWIFSNNKSVLVEFTLNTLLSEENCDHRKCWRHHTIIRCFVRSYNFFKTTALCFIIQYCIQKYIESGQSLSDFFSLSVQKKRLIDFIFIEQYFTNIRL